MRSVLCLLTALGLSVMILSCGGYDSSPENKGRCQTNLTVIYQKLRAKSDEGGPPPRLGMIYPFPLTDRTLFRCPSSSDDPTRYEEGQVLQPNQCSYIYNHLGTFTELDDDVRNRLLLLYEKKEFHGPGRMVAYASGKVAFVERPQFNEDLAYTEKWIKENVK